MSWSDRVFYPGDRDSRPTRPFGVSGLAGRLGGLSLLLGVMLAGLFTGCALVDRGVGRAAGGYLATGALVFQREPDTRLAREAIPSNFKLLEILIERSPRDRRLLALAAQYLGMYAYAFVEPESEQLELSDLDAAKVERARAAAFYLRGRDYGLRALAHHRGLVEALSGTEEARTAALAKVGRGEVPALFWTAFCWGSWANLSLEDPQALSDAAVVQGLMARALALDESYYYGGAHLFFGALLSRLPPGAGGDVAGSLQHFERAMALSQQHFWMTQVFFARYYAVRVQDAQLFRKTLEAVLAADIRPYADERLANELAQERARFYLAHQDEYFLETLAPEATPEP